MLRRLGPLLALLAPACGGEVLVQDVSAEVDPPTEHPFPESACNQYTTRGSCCAARCRTMSIGGERSCFSEAQDCALNPGICPEGTACVIVATSGNGGCDWGYSYEEVGSCMPL